MHFRDKVIVLLIIMKVDNRKPPGCFILSHPRGMFLGDLRIDHLTLLSRDKFLIERIQLFHNHGLQVCALLIQNPLHRIHSVLVVVNANINIRHLHVPPVPQILWAGSVGLWE